MGSNGPSASGPVPSSHAARLKTNVRLRADNLLMLFTTYLRVSRLCVVVLDGGLRPIPGRVSLQLGCKLGLKRIERCAAAQLSMVRYGTYSWAGLGAAGPIRAPNRTAQGLSMSRSRDDFVIFCRLIPFSHTYQRSGYERHAERSETAHSPHIVVTRRRLSV